jgi:RNA polymerase sigma-70 factor (ECF subfamily)
MLMPEAKDLSWAAEQARRWGASRSPEALGELLKWQRNRAYAIACRILGREADAEDAVQEAFVKLLAAAPGFRTPAEFCAMVSRSVSQRAIDLARKVHRRQVLEKIMSHDRSPTSRAPLAEAEKAEALKVLQEELAVMDPEDRALLALCCQESQGVSAAADALDLPRETARDRLRQLLGRLRARLSKRGLALALLPLVTLFQQGGAAEAGEALCRVLNAQLPGLPCQSISAAGPAVLPASVILGEVGLVTTLAAKLAAGAAALVIAGSGAFIWHAVAAPVPGSPAPAASVPARAAPAPRSEPPAPQPPPERPAVRKGKEAKLPLAELPAAVKSAAEGAVKGLVLTEADREEAKGTQVYDLEGRAGDKRYELKVTAEGKVLRVREKADDDVDEEREEEKDDGRHDKKPAAAPAVKPGPPAEVF